VGRDAGNEMGRRSGGGTTGRCPGRSERDWLARVLRALEGRRVGLALADGDRVDECDLVSVPRDAAAPLWVFAGGNDRFVPRRLVVDAWEVTPG
jgi:hypothetical protein